MLSGVEPGPVYELSWLTRACHPCEGACESSLYRGDCIGSPWSIHEVRRMTARHELRALTHAASKDRRCERHGRDSERGSNKLGTCESDGALGAPQAVRCMQAVTGLLGQAPFFGGASCRARTPKRTLAPRRKEQWAQGAPGQLARNSAGYNPASEGGGKWLIGRLPARQGPGHNGELGRKRRVAPLCPRTLKYRPARRGRVGPKCDRPWIPRPQLWQPTSRGDALSAMGTTSRAIHFKAGLGGLRTRS